MTGEGQMPSTWATMTTTATITDPAMTMSMCTGLFSSNPRRLGLFTCVTLPLDGVLT